MGRTEWKFSGFFGIQRLFQRSGSQNFHGIVIDKIYIINGIITALFQNITNRLCRTHIIIARFKLCNKIWISKVIFINGNILIFIRSNNSIIVIFNLIYFAHHLLSCNYKL